MRLVTKLPIAFSATKFDKEKPKVTVKKLERALHKCDFNSIQMIIRIQKSKWNNSAHNEWIKNGIR